MKYVLTIIILIFTTALITQAQVTDSAKPRTAQADSTVASAPAQEGDVENDFNPGLLMFALVAVGIILAGVVIGTILTLITLLGIFAMVSFGILSSSIIVGIYTRSITKAFKTFFLLCSTAAGVVLGCALLYVMNVFTRWYKTDDIILMGSLFGLVAGIAGGMITFYFLQRLAAWLRTKIIIQTIPK
jgi:uncharacterized membrane protein